MRVVKIPNREDFPTRLSYQRRLAMTESTNQLEQVAQPILDVYAQRRVKAGLEHKPPIPPHPDLPANFQFRPPTKHSQNMVASYARYAAGHYRHEKNPDLAVKSVKAYRVVHAIVSAQDFADPDHPLDPLDPTTYLAYYQGEFDIDGKMLDENDPFLYWLLPIYRERPPFQVQGPFRVLRDTEKARSKGKLRNYLDIHAGVPVSDDTEGE
jgi:hypothetical protein